jgi:non-ribosomal peptide synthetase component F
VQPADVADWQRRCLASGAYDGARAYWRERLAGMAARPELPHDGPRHDHAGAWIQRELGAPVTSSLRELARATGSTLFVVLLAALAQLTAELTGDGDVMLGTLVAGRDRPEVRPLIGLFLNTLPLRVQLDGSAGFDAALASARDATLGALAHAQLPFERVVADLRPPRQPRRNPIFDVVLNYLPPVPAGMLGDLTVDALEPGPVVSAPFDVMWRVVERGSSLQIRVEYRRGRFAPDRIRAWLDRYLDLLARGAGAH